MFSIIMFVQNEYSHYEEVGCTVNGFASQEEAIDFMRTHWDSLSEKALECLYRNDGGDRVYASILRACDKSEF